MLGGSNFSCTVRASAVCTTSFVVGNAFTALMSTNVTFNVSVTLGSASAVHMKVLFSDDVSATAGSLWFAESIQDTASGTVSTTEYRANVYERVYVFAANGRYRIPVECQAKWFTAAISCTSDTTGTLVAVAARAGIIP